MAYYYQGPRPSDPLSRCPAGGSGGLHRSLPIRLTLRRDRTILARLTMKRTRQVLVLTLVATALCADRVVTAAPTLRETLASASADPLARLATNLGSRFSGTFRRTAVTTGVRLHQERHDQLPVAPTARLERDAPAIGVLVLAQGSPFQFRLPPPSL